MGMLCIGPRALLNTARYVRCLLLGGAKEQQIEVDHRSYSNRPPLYWNAIEVFTRRSGQKWSEAGFRS
jgi:hypothetical protein